VCLCDTACVTLKFDKTRIIGTHRSITEARFQQNKNFGYRKQITRQLVSTSQEERAAKSHLKDLQ